MRINMTGNTFEGGAKVIGKINGVAVSDELDAQLKEELSRDGQSIELRELIKKIKGKN